MEKKVRKGGGRKWDRGRRGREKGNVNRNSRNKKRGRRKWKGDGRDGWNRRGERHRRSTHY